MTSDTEPQDVDEEKIRTFEDLLEVIKPEGRWQYQIIILVLIHQILACFTNTNYVYITGVPNYHCTIPELEKANWSLAEIQNVIGTKSSDQCSMYDLNYTAVASGQDEVTNRTILCRHWKFIPNEYYGYTAVNEWNLICSSSALRPTIQSVYMFGVLSGCLIGGILADSYGRKTATMWLLTLFTIGGLCCSFVPYYSTFLVFRFITGLGGMGAFVVMYSLALECLSANIRAKWTCYLNLSFYVIGLVFVGAAYGIRNFRYLILVYAVPSIATPFLCYWLLPESPRWLITHNRIKEAHEILSDAAKKNKVKFKNDETLNAMIHNIFKNIEKDEYNEVMNSNTLTLKERFSSWMKKIISAAINSAFVVRLFCIGYTWFGISLCSFGVTYLATKLNFGPYIPAVLESAKAIPACLLMKPSVDYFGRKPVMIVCFLATSAFAIASAFSPENPVWLAFTFAEISGFFLIILFCNVYLVTGELFPTEVRSMALCFGSVCARIGSIIAPYIVDLLISPYKFVPGIIFGGTALLGAFVTFFLPETKKKCLPNTLMEIKKECGSKTEAQNIDA